MKIEIVDNFLKQDDFQELSSLSLEKATDNSIKTHHNEINKKNDIIESCFDKSLIKTLNINCHNKAFEILKKLNHQKAELYDYSDFSILETGKNYKFPIHDDTPNKLLSGVIYLYPKNNLGTFFYSNKNGESKQAIEWKQNRGVFFSRIEKETWHSFQGDGLSNRIALVYNLMTYRIKEVYKIEKKNYYSGQLRWKLNPFLYRYFKFTI